MATATEPDIYPPFCAWAILRGSASRGFGVKVRNVRYCCCLIDAKISAGFCRLYFTRSPRAVADPGWLGDLNPPEVFFCLSVCKFPRTCFFEDPEPHPLGHSCLRETRYISHNNYIVKIFEKPHYTQTMISFISKYRSRFKFTL